MGFEGPLHRRAYGSVDATPTRAIVFTQGHYDHVGGTESLRDEGTELIAQTNFTSWRADNERLEAFRSRNAAFAWIRAILAAMEHAQSLGAGATSQARPEPTMTFGDRLELSIGGRDLVLLSTPGGETTDALVIWLPDTHTAFTGNLFGPLFGHVPNLVTMRGDRYRDALAYVESLDLVLGLAPARLLTGHFDPIEGTDRIAEEITAMRDATQWVHDRTVEGMNAGQDVYALMREIRVPEHFDLGEGYGKTSWNVRAIWETYAGWFHHGSTTELYDIPASTVAPDLVAVAGAGALVDAARVRLDAG
jgi:alkyl sulfatase BDS1-like metallo-beta-lactamase superfamily hydrolase